MLKYSERVHDVERAVGEVEPFRIHHAQIRPQTLLLEAAPSEIDAAGCQIDAGHLRPSARELEVVGSEADANFEHALPSKAVIAKSVLHPRLLGVTMALDSGERLGSSQRLLASCNGAGGISTPLLLRCASHGACKFVLRKRGSLSGPPCTFRHGAIVLVRALELMVATRGIPSGSDMPSRQASVLVICHVSAGEVAAVAARAIYMAPPEQIALDSGNEHGSSDAVLDLLCYGRASDDHPAPRGARLVGPSVQENVSRRDAVRILYALRRRRYDVVALSQPALGLSRARGLLLAYSYLVSGGRSVVLDPIAARVVRPVRLGLVVKDLARWLALQLVSRGFAAAMVKPIARLAARATTVRTPANGSVVYLRTDVDLSIAPLRVGGSVAHSEGILQALLDRGHDIAYWGTGDVDGVPAAIPRLRLPVLLKGNLPTEVAELVSGLIQGFFGIRRLSSPAVRPTGFVYQRYSLNNFAGVILSRRCGVPLVLEANGSEAKWRQDFGTLKYPKLAYACERLILRRADVVAAVSANAAEDLLASGAPPERLRVVPNGVSVERFAGATPMSLPGDLADAFVVCFVGLFYPWHGARFLAEAFALLHQRHTDARLLLVGDGEEAPVIRSALERRGATDAVHFTGLVPRRDAPRYMAAADALVSPHADVHRFIGSPIKLFEYMAAGKPIVATRVGQIQDVLTDGETALLVAPEDAGAMAGALERLYADRELGQRLGRAAQREAASGHSWEARLAAMLDGGRESVRSGDPA